MVRYDLAFLLCCCKACLGSTHDPKKEDFYDLLEVEKDATQDEIKRAYKRQSLLMHPDKLAQKGRTVTDVDQARFTRMKEAYEILSDPHKRETYDAIGEKGLKWMEEPFSLDPQEMAHNFANSSTVDRSKIFGIFVAIAIIIFILPIMVCLQFDQKFGPRTSWIWVLSPLWIWDIAFLLYHIRVIMMGPIHKPDNIPDHEWIDPLPMSKRILSLLRFILIVIFEILMSLKLDHKLGVDWWVIFTPIYLHEGTTLFKKVPLAKMRIVTVEDLENALGKPFIEFTDDEKDTVAKKYSVVPSATSPEFEAAHKLKARAKQDINRLSFRVIFLIFFILQLDEKMKISWWLIFTPFWVMSFCICCGTFQTFAAAQAAVNERDPERSKGNENKDSPLDFDSTDENENAPKQQPLSDEERNELKSQVIQAGSKFVTSCISQAFIVFIVCMFVGKLQGADYSSMWIISPLLFIASLILCLLGCTIFCITSADEDEREFDTQQGFNKHKPYSEIKKRSEYIPPNQDQKAYDATMNGDGKMPPKSTWDPERGEVWEGYSDPHEVELVPQNKPQILESSIGYNEQVKTSDLLDMNSSPSVEMTNSIEPTASEVEDLD